MKRFESSIRDISLSNPPTPADQAGANPGGRAGGTQSVLQGAPTRQHRVVNLVGKRQFCFDIDNRGHRVRLDINKLGRLKNFSQSVMTVRLYKTIDEQVTAIKQNIDLK